MMPLRLARRYMLNVLIALDQLVNAAFCGCPDETISSVLGKARRGDYGRAAAIVTAPLRWVVDVVFAALGDPDHCAASIEDDEGPDSVWIMLRRK